MTRPPRTDALLALAGLALVMVEQVAGPGLSPADLLFVPGFAAVAWRRTAPLEATLVCIFFLGAGEFIEAKNTNVFSIFLALALVLYSFAVHADRARLVPGLVVAGLMCCAISVEAGLNNPEGSSTGGVIVGGILFALFVVVLPPLGIGLGVRRHGELRAQLERRAEELEAERERHAAAAAGEERARMAADLHAVVAQGVRGMLDQVAAARATALTDPDRAEAAILASEERGRDALTEMRALLGVLRRGDEDLALAPQPSLARLDALATHVRGDGLEVSLRVEGTPRPLTPGLDVAAYRVVEDALAEAAGSSQAEVVVRWAPRDVQLEVGIDGPQLAAPDALGPARQRVELFGGRLDAGRRPRGGSAMRAEVPV